ncbi:hypothetical protein KIPB_006792 [Kipferlia bialata]|uniref:Uncharacterized protein n=1 Tax=Kipferlia bialata TaxID=797122 RepID=A0A391NML7_9EUKA|nr:hypothetical protein KIPB_006792 [Kipferlia bialata]|eukprot:g6792.t1
MQLSSRDCEKRPYLLNKVRGQLLSCVGIPVSGGFGLTPVEAASLYVTGRASVSDDAASEGTPVPGSGPGPGSGSLTDMLQRVPAQRVACYLELQQRGYAILPSLPVTADDTTTDCELGMHLCPDAVTDVWLLWRLDKRPRRRARGFMSPPDAMLVFVASLDSLSIDDGGDTVPAAASLKPLVQRVSRHYAMSVGDSAPQSQGTDATESTDVNAIKEDPRLSVLIAMEGTTYRGAIKILQTTEL